MGLKYKFKVADYPATKSRMNHFAEASSDNALFWDNVLEFAGSIALSRFAEAIADKSFFGTSIASSTACLAGSYSVALAR